jgi:hypothetical protein
LLNEVGDLFVQQNADGKDIRFQCDDGGGSLTDYLTLDGSATNIKVDKDMRFSDNVEAQFGNSGDLKIEHNATDSVIKNLTGDLYIENAADDKDIIFKCDDGSGGTETYFFLDGSENGTSPLTVFPDNSRLTFGTGNDLNISHEAGNSYIQNTTGDLYIKQRTNDGDMIFQCDDGSGGDTAYLTLDGSTTKVLIHKEVDLSSHLSLVDSAALNFGNANDLQIYHNGTNNMIDNVNGDISIRQLADDKDIRLRCDNGSGGETDYILLDGSEVSVNILTQKVIMTNLPTSDPGTTGQLWNDNGTLKISAGG